MQMTAHNLLPVNVADKKLVAVLVVAFDAAANIDRCAVRHRLTSALVSCVLHPCSMTLGQAHSDTEARQLGPMRL
jgi:hypothetical protein